MSSRFFRQVPRRQREQSYSERQLYEAALERLTREIAVVNGAVSGNDTGTGNESEENENDAQYVGCAACAPGTFVEVTNATECTPCPAGTFLQGEGSKNSADCLPCGKGSFSPVAGLVRAGAFPNPGTV